MTATYRTSAYFVDDNTKLMYHLQKRDEHLEAGWCDVFEGTCFTSQKGAEMFLARQLNPQKIIDAQSVTYFDEYGVVLRKSGHFGSAGCMENKT